jgi:two-component system response regulator
MPKKDGHEALSEIKASPDLGKTPVLVLTTSRSDEDIAICQGAGADSYVTKPLSYSEWIKTIRGMSEQWLQSSS